MFHIEAVSHGPLRGDCTASSERYGTGGLHRNLKEALGYNECIFLTGDKLSNLGNNGIFRCCTLEHEWTVILWECHQGVAGSHYGGNKKTCKVMQAILL